MALDAHQRRAALPAPLCPAPARRWAEGGGAGAGNRALERQLPAPSTDLRCPPRSPGSVPPCPADTRASLCLRPQVPGSPSPPGGSSSPSRSPGASRPQQGPVAGSTLLRLLGSLGWGLPAARSTSLLLLHPTPTPPAPEPRPRLSDLGLQCGQTLTHVTQQGAVHAFWKRRRTEVRTAWRPRGEGSPAQGSLCAVRQGKRQ